MIPKCLKDLAGWPALGLALLGMVSNVAAGGEMREWTSARGAKIQAEFVELKFNTVVLKTAEGKLVEIQIAQLGPDDQVLARKLALDKARGVMSGSGGEVVAVKTNLLPHFADGKWKGMHAAYEFPKMDVAIDTNGFPIIYLKDQGRRIGPPITTGWAIYYYTPDSVLTKYRLVEVFEDPPPPSVKPERVKYRAHCQADARVDAEFVVTENQVDLEFEFREPATQEYRGTFNFGLRLHGTHSFPDGTPREKIIQATAGYKLSFKEYRGRTIEYEYHPHLSLTNAIESATIKGPWGPRVLTVSQRQGALQIGNYTLTPLYAGYSIHKYLGNGSKTPPIRLTVE